MSGLLTWLEPGLAMVRPGCAAAKDGQEAERESSRSLVRKQGAGALAYARDRLCLSGLGSALLVLGTLLGEQRRRRNSFDGSSLQPLVVPLSLVGLVLELLSGVPREALPYGRASAMLLIMSIVLQQDPFWRVLPQLGSAVLLDFVAFVACVLSGRYDEPLAVLRHLLTSVAAAVAVFRQRLLCALLLTAEALWGFCGAGGILHVALTAAGGAHSDCSTPGVGDGGGAGCTAVMAAAVAGSPPRAQAAAAAATVAAAAASTLLAFNGLLARLPGRLYGNHATTVNAAASALHGAVLLVRVLAAPPPRSRGLLVRCTAAMAANLVANEDPWVAAAAQLAALMGAVAAAEARLEWGGGARWGGGAGAATAGTVTLGLGGGSGEAGWLPGFCYTLVAAAAAMLYGSLSSGKHVMSYRLYRKLYAPAYYGGGYVAVPMPLDEVLRLCADSAAAAAAAQSADGGGSNGTQNSGPSRVNSTQGSAPRWAVRRSVSLSNMLPIAGPGLGPAGSSGGGSGFHTPAAAPADAAAGADAPSSAEAKGASGAAVGDRAAATLTAAPTVAFTPSRLPWRRASMPEPAFTVAARAAAAATVAAASAGLAGMAAAAAAADREAAAAASSSTIPSSGSPLLANAFDLDEADVISGKVDFPGQGAPAVVRGSRSSGRSSLAGQPDRILSAVQEGPEVDPPSAPLHTVEGGGGGEGSTDSGGGGSGDDLFGDIPEGGGDGDGLALPLLLPATSRAATSAGRPASVQQRLSQLLELGLAQPPNTQSGSHAWQAAMAAAAQPALGPGARAAREPLFGRLGNGGSGGATASSRPSSSSGANTTPNAAASLAAAAAAVAGGSVSSHFGAGSVAISFENWAAMDDLAAVLLGAPGVAPHDLAWPSSSLGSSSRRLLPHRSGPAASPMQQQLLLQQQQLQEQQQQMRTWTTAGVSGSGVSQWRADTGGPAAAAAALGSPSGAAPSGAAPSANSPGPAGTASDGGAAAAEPSRTTSQWPAASRLLSSEPRLQCPPSAAPPPPQPPVTLPLPLQPRATSVPNMAPQLAASKSRGVVARTGSMGKSRLGSSSTSPLSPIASSRSAAAPVAPPVPHPATDDDNITASATSPFVHDNMLYSGGGGDGGGGAILVPPAMAMMPAFGSYPDCLPMRPSQEQLALDLSKTIASYDASHGGLGRDEGGGGAEEAAEAVARGEDAAAHGLPGRLAGGGAPAGTVAVSRTTRYRRCSGGVPQEYVPSRLSQDATRMPTAEHLRAAPGGVVAAAGPAVAVGAARPLARIASGGSLTAVARAAAENAAAGDLAAGAPAAAMPDGGMLRVSNAGSASIAGASHVTASSASLQSFADVALGGGYLF
ncbi:hypothetical protein TSOC_003180 [Tetrabaena socialis]|uniref:Uncharacterized protein n=1 Tax=Tetrabaena socialis TaxID=47790 RepID=A0A2J8ACA4_9CHLO|nr:hypothetical protein TSOC_003180 [Tetrabaena socialis]|eukprot:PNH10123.1 hypothetical protein TSOC_003180 [Tetrabaena socialis]